jgi:hypothetical protein
MDEYLAEENYETMGFGVAGCCVIALSNCLHNK